MVNPPLVPQDAGMPGRVSPDRQDAALLRRMAAGDETAFEAFYRNFHDRLFRFIYRMTRKRELVEEVIHETLLVVWQKPDSYNGNSKVSTWVFGIAYRKALKALVDRGPVQKTVELDGISETVPDPQLSPAGQVELNDWLAVALDSLPAEQLAVVELTFYEGLSYQEIAAILGCPENTVKTRMFHARRKLQNVLNRTSGEGTP